MCLCVCVHIARGAKQPQPREYILICPNHYLQAAYVIFKKKAAYNAIKGVNSVSMEFLSNSSTGPVLA